MPKHFDENEFNYLRAVKRYSRRDLAIHFERFRADGSPNIRWVKYMQESLRARGMLQPIEHLTENTQANSILDNQIRAFTKNAKNPIELIELADKFDVSPKRIQEAITRLQEQKFLVHLNEGTIKAIEPSRGGRSILPYQKSRKITFGIVSDAHLCSKYAEIEKLHTFYALLKERGVTQVFDTGNFIDGEARFNRNDLHVFGLDNQLQFWAETWPKQKGISTHFIAGDDHEGWYTQNVGVDIGAYAQDVARRMGRDDLHYLGYMEHDVVFPAPQGETVVRLQHPGGGSAYALSYAPQKLIESLLGGEKPNILCLGHWHKAGFFFIRNVHCVLSGCFQAQTPFMRKKHLAAHIGGWIISFLQDTDGEVLSFTTEFVPFYETKSTQNERWAHR